MIQPVRVIRIESVIECSLSRIVSPPDARTGFVLQHAGTPNRPATPAGATWLLRLAGGNIARFGCFIIT
jgi:hypothetical protein